ncbi:MAG: class I SAM-dependent methyltransferase [Betaproteobacteria bacterium]|nr:class I SAM-dependent methyltransferase [Betaproteobacteria bacterium]
MSLKKDIDGILRRIPDASFTIHYWDGDAVSYGQGKSEFVVRLKDSSDARRMLDNLLVRVPEAYVAGSVEVEGDLQRLLRLCYRLDPQLLRLNFLQKLGRSLIGLKQRNSLHGARDNVSRHYDLGNEFFKLWLDREMNYSCAYFEHPNDDLETAQRQKLHHICTKLRLAPGQRVLDIGSGWGALAAHAAREFGARVVGITLSEEQRSLAQAKTKQSGLDGKVEVRLQDYRQIQGEPFDAVASVGMIEHVGRAYVPAYMRAVARSLHPGGYGVFQWISHAYDGRVTPWIARHVFPGMYLPPLDEVAREMVRAGLRITDVENLKPHYAMTLDAWIERFEKNAPTIMRMLDERFVRLWRMYLNSASAAFKFGELNLWQVTFTHGYSSEMPLTRRYLYEKQVQEAPRIRLA